MAGVYYCAMHGCNIPDDILTWMIVGIFGFIVGIFGFIVVPAIIGAIIDRRNK